MIMSLALIESCYYDDPPEILPIDPTSVSYGTHIVPILASSCATSNCHDGTATPDLLVGTTDDQDDTYVTLRARYINTTIPTESAFYISVNGGGNGIPAMPGDGLIPEVDRQVILAWIQNGAPNN